MHSEGNVFEWLVEKRKKEKLTQAQVAEKAGISQTYYANIENGNRGRKLPVETAKKIAFALGIKWVELYERGKEE